MTLEVWELLEHALRQQYSTGQSQNRAPSVENSGRVIMKNPHFCLSVFVGKYMTTTYTKACEVDFETLGSIKSCLEPPATNRPGSQLSVLGENKRVCDRLHVVVYFLINTCLTGLRSSGILSREVSVFIIIGLTARRGGEGKGKGRWRANTCGGGAC